MKLSRAFSWGFLYCVMSYAILQKPIAWINSWEGPSLYRLPAIIIITGIVCAGAAFIGRYFDLREAREKDKSND